MNQIIGASAQLITLAGNNYSEYIPEADMLQLLINLGLVDTIHVEILFVDRVIFRLFMTFVMTFVSFIYHFGMTLYNFCIIYTSFWYDFCIILV